MDEKIISNNKYATETNNKCAEYIGKYVTNFLLDCNTKNKENIAITILSSNHDIDGLRAIALLSEYENYHEVVRSVAIVGPWTVSCVREISDSEITEEGHTDTDMDIPF